MFYGGMVRHYRYDGMGPNDRTLDLDTATEPDIVADARDPNPSGFRAVLADPPYSKGDTARYYPGAAAYPSPRLIVRRAFEALLPRPPKSVRLVAVVAVLVGHDNVARLFTVYQKIS